MKNIFLFKFHFLHSHIIGIEKQEQSCFINNKGMPMEKHVLSISEKKNLAYERWLRKFIKAPSSKELDDMEKEALKLKPQNNPYYQPLQGA